MPPKKVRGTLITKAHGQDTTRNIKARYSQVGKVLAKLPERIGGNKAKAMAAKTTMGVYIFANLVMKVSLFDFRSVACSTRLII